MDSERIEIRKEGCTEQEAQILATQEKNDR